MPNIVTFFKTGVSPSNFFYFLDYEKSVTFATRVDSSVPCGVPVEQQLECEWRCLVRELRERFLVHEYEYRLASRKQSKGNNGFMPGG